MNVDPKLKIDPSRWHNQIVDFTQLDLHKHLFDQVDVVFSCLGTTKKAAGSIQKQRTVDVDYQYAVASIARRAGVKEYFLVSSTGAAANSGSAYLKMKGELEDQVTALDFQRCVIVRPSLLLGEREQKRAGEFFAGKLIPLLSYVPLLRKYRPIHGSEVAKKMAHLAASGATKQNQCQDKGLVEIYELDQVFNQ